MTDILKNLIFVLGVIFTGAAAYLLLIESETSTLNRDLNADQEQARLQSETQEYLSRLQVLQDTTITTDILEDQRFQALQDNGVGQRRIIPGRNNPFERIYETETEDDQQ